MTPSEIDPIATLPAHPPRQPSSLPGLKVGSMRLGSTLLIPLLFVAFVTIIMLLSMLTDPRTRLAFSKTAHVSGTVLSVQEDQGCGRGEKTVVYEFRSPAGLAYRATAVVCQNSAYAAVKAGDAVPIRYSVADPSLSLIEGNGDQANGIELIPLLLFPLMFICLFFLPFAVPLIKPILDARKMVRLGIVTEASVVFIKPRTGFYWPGFPGFAGSSGFDVFVRYRDESAAECEASAHCPNSWLASQLAVGSTVYIAYRTGKPQKAALLEAYLR